MSPLRRQRYLCTDRSPKQALICQREKLGRDLRAGAMSRSLASSQGPEACGLVSRSRKRCSVRAFPASTPL